VAPRRHDVLADLECGGRADRLDRDVDALAAGQGYQPLCRLPPNAFVKRGRRR
jgi:hypothetical protein